MEPGWFPILNALLSNDLSGVSSTLRARGLSK